MQKWNVEHKKTQKMSGNEIQVLLADAVKCGRIRDKPVITVYTLCCSVCVLGHNPPLSEQRSVSLRTPAG